MQLNQRSKVHGSHLKKTSRNQGVAIITALALLLVVSGLMVLMASRALNQIRSSKDNLAITQTLSLARGGANLAAQVLFGEARVDFQNIVTAQGNANVANNWIYGGNGNNPNPATVIADLQNAGVPAAFQTSLNNRFCNANLTAPQGDTTVNLYVFVTNTACAGTADAVNVNQFRSNVPPPRFVSGTAIGAAQAVPQTYAIPYVMVAEAITGEYRRNIVLQGEYQFTFGQGSFARYGLFTNRHTTGNGGNIWFTSNTLFDGPVHSNQVFRFYQKPWFGDNLSSAGCVNPGPTSCLTTSSSTQISGLSNSRWDEWAGRSKAYYWGIGWRDDVIANPIRPGYKGPHGPTVEGQIDLAAGYEPLPTNNNDQQAMSLGLNIPPAQQQPAPNGSRGLFINGNVDELEMWAGDVNGSPVTSGATFQYTNVTQGGVTTQFRLDNNNNLFVFVPPNNWVIQQRNFNGVVFVNGRVDRLTGPPRANADDPDTAPPAIASFSNVTLTTDGNVRITGDLKYERPPCESGPTRNAAGGVDPSVCNDLTADNVFGIYTDAGDILIGNSNGDATLEAPDNVTIHSVLMSGKGSIRVENHDQPGDRGSVNLTGGMIENFYGAFGTFGGYHGRTGFGRNITYDPRMRSGLAPRGFPTVTAREVTTVFVNSFGQREQIY